MCGQALNVPKNSHYCIMLFIAASCFTSIYGHKCFRKWERLRFHYKNVCPLIFLNLHKMRLSEILHYLKQT